MERAVKTIIADSEDLLKAGVASARSALADASKPAQDYVRGHPWGTLGLAAALGALIGFLAAKR